MDRLAGGKFQRSGRGGGLLWAFFLSCLGAGGCKVCASCAHPEPCRFPEKAHSSMEAYGLFVTQVCRDNNAAYYHGPRTITYSACVLF